MYFSESSTCRPEFVVQSLSERTESFLLLISFTLRRDHSERAEERSDIVRIHQEKLQAFYSHHDSQYDGVISFVLDQRTIIM